MVVAFKTKNAAVYEVLRKDIVDGKLKPGQKIVMSEMAKELGLSELPIREAIRRLESEGFVRFTPHVGATVRKMDEKEFVEIYLIRIELEALATRLAVPHITKKDIDYLEKRNWEMKAALENRKPEKLGGLNRDFHLRIYKASSNQTLYDLICNLWEKAERTKSVFAYVPERAESSVEEHFKIIDAIRSKDVALAEKLTKEQKNLTMVALQRYLHNKHNN